MRKSGSVQHRMYPEDDPTKSSQSLPIHGTAQGSESAGARSSQCPPPVIVLNGLTIWPEWHAAIVHAFQSEGRFQLIRPKLSKTTPFASTTAVIRKAIDLVSRGMPVVITKAWLDIDQQSLAYARAFDRALLKLGAVSLWPDMAWTDAPPRNDILLVKNPSGHPGLFLDLGDVYIMAKVFQSINEMGWVQSKNLNGNLARAKWLIVGDVTNPRFQGFDHWPWHDDKASARCISELLDILDLNEDQLCWSNANPRTEAEIFDLRDFLRDRPSLDVIALGNNADKTLTQMGIRHATVFHPSYARRFSKTPVLLNQLKVLFA